MTSKTADSKIHIYRHRRAPVAAFIYLGLVGLCILVADLLPLPFLPQQLDLLHIYQPPFAWKVYSTGLPFHWLGTDHLGRDVLATVIYGCRTAFLLSIPAMVIATALGLLFGGLAGFYGNKTIKLSMLSLMLILITVSLAYYYSFYIRQMPVAESVEGKSGVALIVNWLLFIVLVSAGIFLSSWINKKTITKWHIYLPIDQMVLKCIELLSSIPRIIFILCLAAYTRPSLINLVLISGFTYWTEPARLIRAELLRIKTLNYIESARALGLADFYILIRHALPNSLSSIIVAATFGIAGLISLESTLSFLNIGMPADLASWGKMVASARNNFSAWWLVLFPGLTLCGTVLSLQSVSNWLVEKINPRNR
jgi:peptide/nickel transport system permease protein